MKLQFEDVRDYFRTHDCELLETCYVDCRHLMKYRCSCGNISVISYTNFRTGRRCKKCASAKTTRHTRRPYRYVRDYFQERGCELLQTEYVNNSTPMTYRCKCGCIAKISFANFQGGKRCKKCAINRISGENNYLWNHDREQVEQNALFRKKCYAMLNYTLKATGKKKRTKSKAILGYTPKQLQEHITSHSNWKNCDADWHLDHIFPIKAFLDYGITDLSVINNLNNLRPVPASVNRKKHTAYDKEEFEAWLNTLS